MEFKSPVFLYRHGNPYDILTEGEAMARGTLTADTTILQMALVGYKIEKQKIEAKIGEIQAQLKGNRSPASASAGKQEPGTKRHLSAAALRRISVAQKKRWAAHRKRAAQAAREA